MMLSAALQYRTRTAAVSRVIQDWMSNGDGAEAVAWRSIRMHLHPVHEDIGISWDDTTKAWDVSAGGKGLLFGRYLTTCTVGLQASTNLSFRVKSAPRIQVAEIRDVIKLTDGRDSIRFTTNQASLSTNEWERWVRSGFNSEVIGFLLVTNGPVPKAELAVPGIGKDL